MAEVSPTDGPTPEERLEKLAETAKRIDGEEEGIYDLPDHPKMDYEDIFGEPRAYREDGLGKHIHKGLTKVFGGAFNYVQSTLYYVLVMITGLFLGTAWGLVFGVVIYLVNWIIHPIYKLLFILLRLVGTLLRPVVRMVIDPLFQGMGLCLGGINGNFMVKVRGTTLDLNRATIHPLEQVTSFTEPTKAAHGPRYVEGPAPPVPVTTAPALGSYHIHKGLGMDPNKPYKTPWESDWS